MHLLLYFLFVLSGAAGLIYESIWSRYLGLFVGHSAYAQIIVLTIFLGGMALGALAVGRRSTSLREPLLWYAGIELLVGVLGLVFHDVYGAATGLAYDRLFPALAAGPARVAAQWGLAALLVLPQSVLLGTTFPLMSAGVLRRSAGQPGRVLALLYFSNSLGAAGGVLLAGFFLIERVGLPGALLFAAMLNVVVAVAAWLTARAAPLPAADPAAPATPARDGAPAPLTRLLLGVAFGTAVASFIYEIGWIRMLSLALGSATHSFELMLSAFILGLALGSLWCHRRADRFRDPLRALGIVQWLMGFAALATLPLYLWSFEAIAVLLGAVGRTDAGYTLFNVGRYGLCLAIMLPSTFCAGITLPLITRTLVVAGSGERAIGFVYGVNTLGSIVGVALAGLLFMPLLGLKGLLVLGAALDMALGVWLLARAAGRRAPVRRLAWGAAGALAAAVGLALIAVDFDHRLLASGVFRHGRMPADEELRILHYADGRTATVSISTSGREGNLTIATNGKPDASLPLAWLDTDSIAAGSQTLHGDTPTQILMPLVTLAHRPDARQVAVIGQGSGVTSHFLLGSPDLERLVTIEIEPEMIRASRRFYPANRRVFDDPRSEFVIDDAKAFFAASGQKFDIILSEPSNPWVSGVAGLFTTEFYARVKRYLTPDGVFGQWVQLYEIDDGLILSVLAAVHQNFPSYEVFMTSSFDLLIVASNQPHLPEPDWSVFQRPAIAADLRHVRPFTAPSLEATRLASRAGLAPLLDRWGQANSDYYPVLDLGAERSRFRRAEASGFLALRARRFDAMGAMLGRRVDFGDGMPVAVPSIPAVRALALGAALRAADQGARPEAGTALDVRTALQRRWSFEAALESGEPPADWRVWAIDAWAIDGDLHAGTAGVADTAFYAALEQFVQRHAAPREARAVVALLRGWSAWDFAGVARAAEPLLAAARRGEPWAPPDDLRDAVVVARLRTGDVAGARAALEALEGRGDRRAGDVRERLLAAYVGTIELTAPRLAHE